MRGGRSKQVRALSAVRSEPQDWLQVVHRYLGYGEIEDRSRRPKVSPKAVSDSIEAGIVAARKMRPTWGPRKLRASLQRSKLGMELASVTTFALIFKRNGLIVPRRRKRRTVPSTQPLLHATAPNALWCIDFKGDILVGKARCYPLPITDAFSRYLIASRRRGRPLVSPAADRDRLAARSL
jgi:putative transposase